MLSKLRFFTSLVENLPTKKKVVTTPATRKSIYAQALERGEVTPIEDLIAQNKTRASENPESSKPFVRPDPNVAVTRKSIYAQALERGEVTPIEDLIAQNKTRASENSESSKPFVRPDPNGAVTRKSIYVQALEEKDLISQKQA